MARWNLGSTSAAKKSCATRPSGVSLIGAPGFEPGTSATRTQRSTGLSHAPDPTRVNQRTGWDSNPRGREPTRFPIVRLKPLGHPSTALRAAEGHRPSLQRREWDSNPRGVATNALAGRRHKPLGHPSKRRPQSPAIAPLGIEPRLSGTRIRRVANYTTGHQEPPVGFEPTTPSLRVTCSTN